MTGPAPLRQSDPAICPVRPGDTVHLADPKKLADEVWKWATGPTDPNAALAIELADWWRTDRLAVTVVEVQPDRPGWFLIVQTPELNGGDSFGVQWGDIEVPEASA